MSLYRNRYRNESIRLQGWDYGSPGYYYVTVYTHNRKRYFGDVVMCGGMHRDGVCVGIHRNGMCGGVEGTHNYASLPPNAYPTQLSPNAHPAQLPANARPAQYPTSGQDPVVRLTPIGVMVRQNWIDIPNHFSFAAIDEFIIMPDHLHGILRFRKIGYRGWRTNDFGPQSQNLTSVMRAFKSATTTSANKHNIEFRWQARYHDDVITSPGN